MEGVRTYLGAQRSFSELELLKVWKGLFYCMWMSDRPRAQQRLANDMASLVAVVDKKHAIQFLAAFWSIMCREWGRIDSLRIDKFLLLLRRFVEVGFKLLLGSGWESKVVEGYVTVLSQWPLK